MKLKILNVIFSNHDEFMGELKEALFNGKNSNEANQTLSFDSFETFKRLMTANKLEILMAIARIKPTSINQLSKILNREYPHVLKDCNSLLNLGFIKLEIVESARKQFVPKLAFDYDIIVVKSRIEEIFSISEKSNKVLLMAREKNL